MKTRTMPSGLTLRGENVTELSKALFRHSVAALSERLCPLCSLPLADTTCLGPLHRPVRFHLCPDRQRVTEFYLDVPGGAQRRHCDECGAWA